MKKSQEEETREHEYLKDEMEKVLAWIAPFTRPKAPLPAPTYSSPPTTYSAIMGLPPREKHQAEENRYVGRSRLMIRA